jgi:2-hydroxychromene-2-carboxylate isomerase
VPGVRGSGRFAGLDAPGIFPDVAERLQVWFEFASTYSYPAVCRAPGLAAACGVALEWRPFLLGPIFQAQGWNDSPFNIYPVKGRYMWRDLERICAAHGIPLRRPSVFPRGSLLAARVAYAGAREPWVGDFIQSVYHANFAEDRDIASRDVVADLLARLGQPAAVLERADAPESKARLRAETEEAIRLGVFGAPSFVVGDELFWGNDRLEEAIAWCRRGA